MNMKIIVKNQAGEILQTAIFTNEQRMADWIQLLETKEPWGKASYQKEITPPVEIKHPEIPAVLNGETVIKAAVSAWTEKIPGTYETIPAEYTYEIVDLTDELAKQQILKTIAELEILITARRLREAMITGDKSFIEQIDSQIAELRKQL